jgi:4-alpha-glucanotransferase
MVILLFAFGANLPQNPYAPHNYKKDCVAYTGTQDNNTIQGWLRNEATEEDKRRLADYLGRDTLENAHWDLIRLAMTSVAVTVIIPLQDVMGLGEEARMNMPSRSKGNWEWRFEREDWTPELEDKLKRLATLTGRWHEEKPKTK